MATGNEKLTQSRPPAAGRLGLFISRLLSETDNRDPRLGRQQRRALARYERIKYGVDSSQEYYSSEAVLERYIATAAADMAQAAENIPKMNASLNAAATDMIDLDYRAEAVRSYDGIIFTGQSDQTGLYATYRPYVEVAYGDEPETGCQAPIYINIGLMPNIEIMADSPAIAALKSKDIDLDKTLDSRQIRLKLWELYKAAAVNLQATDPGLRIDDGSEASRAAVSGIFRDLVVWIHRHNFRKAADYCQQFEASMGQDQ